MKGGLATLDTKRGNDADQAAALIELLKGHEKVNYARFAYLYRAPDGSGGIEVPTETVIKSF